MGRRNAWLLGFGFLTACGSSSSAPAPLDAGDAGDDRRVERRAPPAPLDDCTVVDDGCEVDVPWGAVALSYHRESLWVTSDGSLTRIPAGGEATFVREVRTSVAGDFAVTDTLAFIGTMLAVAPKPVLQGFPLDGGAPLELGLTTGLAFGDCVLRDGEQVVWTASDGTVSLLGMVNADGSRPVDLGAVPSPRRAKGMSLVAADGDHAFIAAANRLLHAEVANLANAKELWRGAEDAQLQTVLRDGDQLFFVVDGRVTKMPTFGGVATVVGDIGNAEHLRIADGALVWRTMQFGGNKHTATWWTMPTTGGAARVLMTRESVSGSYAVGGGYFFALARSGNRDVIVRKKL